MLNSSQVEKIFRKTVEKIRTNLLYSIKLLRNSCSL